MESNEITLKQYVIVPKKPRMSTGKIVSQVAHATFEVLRAQNATKNKHFIDEWRTAGMCVIVLQCKDTQQLQNIGNYLNYWNVMNHVYIDEGLTEVDMGTPTALATAVLTKDKHWMFSTLKMYK